MDKIGTRETVDERDPDGKVEEFALDAMIAEAWARVDSWLARQAEDGAS